MKISLPNCSPLKETDFTYGVATAAFQIEGGAEARRPNIWDTFCAKPNTIKDNSDGLVACDHYNRWEQDLDLIQSLEVDAYRFSISWPRVIDINGELDEQGVNFYIQILDILKKKSIKSFVTLYHWDLPQDLEDEGGWLNRETAFCFRDYVDQITKAFGDRVYSYATLNEPFCSAYLGYEIGVHAPGLVGTASGKQAAHHLLLAHGLGMQVLAKNSPNSLNGIVLNVSPCYSKTNSDADKKAAWMADQNLNQWYLMPILEGRYPESFGLLREHEMPVIEKGDMDIISQPLDYLGLNYYTREVYQGKGINDRKRWIDNALPLTDMGWEVYPQGFTEILLQLTSEYRLPPLYITENGAAMPDTFANGQVQDNDRIAYFQGHLKAVSDAIESGVDVRGYFAWSLMDNFEWAEGYAKRFGIVYVDYVTQQRTVKASGLAYRDFIRSRKKLKSQSSRRSSW